jgi:MoxR-like ATPase
MTTQTTQTTKVQEKCILALNTLKPCLVERDEEFDVLFTGILSKQNILFLGSPGIAKTLLVNLFSNIVKDTKVFDRLITKFTIPEELFGPLKVSQLKNDIYERNITNTMLDSHFVFLDEVFKGNSGILNSLLGIMLEKVYINGTTKIKIPLLSLIGASNEIPEEDDGLSALYDRFVVKLNIKPIVEDTNFIKMLKLPKPKIEPILTLDDIQQAQAEVEQIIIPDEVYNLINNIRNRLIQEGLAPTDRTFKVSLEFLKAHTYLNNRLSVSEDDLECLKHTYWSDPDKAKQVNSIILELSNPVMNIIYDLLEQAKDIYNTAIAANKKDTKNTDPHIFDTVQKLVNIKDELVKYTKMVKEKGQNMKKIIKVQEQVDTMQSTLLEKVLSNGKGVFGNAFTKTSD